MCSLGTRIDFFMWHNDDVQTNVFESNIFITKLIGWKIYIYIPTSDHCQIEYFHRLCILFSRPFCYVIHSLTEPNKKKKELVEIAFLLLFVFLFSSLACSIINCVLTNVFFSTTPTVYQYHTLFIKYITLLQCPRRVYSIYDNMRITTLYENPLWSTHVWTSFKS